MMKSILVLLLIALSTFQLLNIEAAVIHYAPDSKRRPGGCYNEKVGHLKAGAEAQLPGRCEKMTCNSSGNGWMELISCGVGLIEMPNCVDIPEDVSKPYPQCCGVKCI